MQECLADHAHSVSFYSGIFAAANAYKNGMSIDELKKYLILEPFDSEFVEYKYLNTDGKYDYYVNIDDRIYIAIAKNAWNYKNSYPLGEGMNFYPYWKAKRYITVNKLWSWGEWNGETVEILEIAPVKLKP